MNLCVRVSCICVGDVGVQVCLCVYTMYVCECACVYACVSKCLCLCIYCMYKIVELYVQEFNRKGTITENLHLII